MPRITRDPRGVSNDPFERILGESRAAQAIRTFGRRAARVDAPVLLLGESGTGKGVLARAIHEASARARGPFVAVNCAAVPDALFESEFFGHVRGAFTGAQYAHKGLFEQAHGGTLFLDEVGELPIIAQAKLLTTIEDRIVRKVGAERTAEVNVRIMAATARALEHDVASGRFRTDLYHRLRILTFTLPPLRARGPDLFHLAQDLIAVFAERYQRPGIYFGAGVLDKLTLHDWPGNVRELANVIESAVVASDGERVEAVSVEFPVGPRARQNMPVLQIPARRERYVCEGSEAEERQRIDAVLERCGGNKTRAAAELGMSRNTLVNRLRRNDRSA